LSRVNDPESRMVSGERALQAGRLLFLENRRLIRSHQDSIAGLTDQWSEVRDLQGLVGEQRLMIESLRDRVGILGVSDFRLFQR
jgi:hypothetical protein